MAEARAELRDEVLWEIFDRRKGLTSARKLHLLALDTEEGDAIGITLKEVTAWLKDKSRAQVYAVNQREWAGANQIGADKEAIWSMDLLVLEDSTEVTDPAQQGYKYVLLVQSRFTRYLWARGIRRKAQDSGEIVGALRSIFAEAGKPRALAHDKGPELENSTVQGFLRTERITGRLKGTDGDQRSTQQNLSILDSAMGRYS